MTNAEIRCAAAAAAAAAMNALPLTVSGLTASNIETAVRETVEAWLVEEE